MKEFFQKKVLPLLRQRKKLVFILTIGLAVVGILYFFFFPKQSAPQYQTATVTRQTLVVSLSESGSVAVANRQPITTAVSGVVSEVDVANGDSVSEGQVIAKITPDSTSLQKQSQAWTSYLSAQNALSGATADLNTLQATLFKTNQAFVKDRGVSNPTADQQADPVYIQENDAWLAAESNYKNQQNVIAQNQSNVTSTYLAYQQLSGVITAPTAGVISDITIAPGMQIAANTSTTAVSSQTIASLKHDGNPIISVTLSEIDATKVKEGQKATITFDAFPNQTFTGKVMGVNTSGSVTSGVTTYPATIVLDDSNDTILPNMSATANIITDVRADVLTVPSQAIVTNNGQSQVRVLKNNQVSLVDVTIGKSSDTDTEITSGLTEGQAVVTSIATTTTSSQTSSPFGGLRGGFGGAGGGTFFRTTGGNAGGR